MCDRLALQLVTGKTFFHTFSRRALKPYEESTKHAAVPHRFRAASYRKRHRSERRRVLAILDTTWRGSLVPCDSENRDASKAWRGCLHLGFRDQDEGLLDPDRLKPD